MAVKQSGRPVSIPNNVTINTIGTLIADDSSLTQCEIAAHLKAFYISGSIAACVACDMSHDWKSQ